MPSAYSKLKPFEARERGQSLEQTLRIHAHRCTFVVLCLAQLVIGATLACADGDAPDAANTVMIGCRLVASQGNYQNIFLQGRCAGAVSALLSFPGVCAPNNGTVAQAIRLVVTYIDARPDRLHESFNALALEALKDAWPCER